MGRCLLVYDISHDRTRARVADACLDYGLDRIQYSAFCGTLAAWLCRDADRETAMARAVEAASAAVLHPGAQPPLEDEVGSTSGGGV